jgi:hypothetical protein
MDLEPGLAVTLPVHADEALVDRSINDAFRNG